MKKTVLAAGAAVLMLVPAGPASAATATETCHPPNYDTVHCACVAVARIGQLILREWQWNCP